MLNKQDKSKIHDIITQWDVSGIIKLYEKDTLQFETVCGFSDRDNTIKTPNNASYLLSTRSKFLQALAILKLVDMNTITLDETFEKYMPEYPHANKITIRHLMMHESGIPDYYYGALMIEKTKEDSHLKLDDVSRYTIESQWFYETIDFSQVLSLIGDALLFEAGTKDYWSATNHIFIEKIIERITKMPAHMFIEQTVFEALGLKDTILGHQANTVSYVCMRDIHLICAPYNGDDHLVWTTSAKDIHLLTQGLRQRKIVSEASWNVGLEPNKRGESLLCYYRNGMTYYESTVLGYEIGIYIDSPSQVSFFHLSNEGAQFKLIDGNWMHFQNQLRALVESRITYPKNTYLDTYHEKNAWDVMKISLDDTQKEFVIDVKTSLCWAFSEPDEKQVYVLMEGLRSVGLMVLAVNPIKNIYAVDILIVDKCYQNRGYGKIMLNEGLKILKNEGAKKIEIIVNRFNTPAHRLYLSLGFKETGVYEGGVRLTKYL